MERIENIFVRRNDDGTADVVLIGHDDVDPVVLLDGQALRVAGRLTVVDKVKADEVADPDVAAVSALFPAWAPGIPVAVGDVYRWDGTLVECIADHSTQSDWTPPATPSLWKVHRTDDGTVPLAWMPGLALTVDDQVTYDGVLYDVLQAHTTQTDWTPGVTPALFAPATD